MPSTPVTGDILTAHLEGIGVRVSSSLKIWGEPNIEDTLVAASREGLLTPDYRVLSLLVDWIEVHGARINVDRLTKLASAMSEKIVKAFWASIARRLKSDPRFKKLRKIYNGPRLDLLEPGTDFLVQKNGEDDRFEKTFIRVPTKTLRHRLSDVLTAEELVRKHLAYKYRVLIGPTYRADMMAYLEKHPKASPSETAKATYGSFATAWQVQKDFSLIRKSRKGAKSA